MLKPNTKSELHRRICSGPANTQQCEVRVLGWAASATERNRDKVEFTNNVTCTSPTWEEHRSRAATFEGRLGLVDSWNVSAFSKQNPEVSVQSAQKHRLRVLYEAVLWRDPAPFVRKEIVNVCWWKRNLMIYAPIWRVSISAPLFFCAYTHKKKYF